jgi:alpha-ketoglutarate-dependent taurine dioxygenase
MPELRVLDPKRDLPLLVDFAADTLYGRPHGTATLLAWYADNRAFLEEALRRHGAVLFRGSGVADPEALCTLARAISGDLLDYVDGNSPRTKLAAGVYTSTEYPARYPISMHNELSYSETWPTRLFFCCATPPATGGETPLADSRAILRHLDPAIVAEFTRRGVRYVRNLHPGRGFGPSWQKTFETEDRGQVEEHLRRTGTTFEWTDKGGLRLTSIRPATAIHPETGEAVWFNQAEQFHPSTHAKEVHDAMKVLCGNRDDLLPQNATFGDGIPIPLATLTEIRQTIARHLVLFPWHKGDVLMLDNLLTCHGRQPFTGERKILAAMTGCLGWEAVRAAA